MTAHRLAARTRLGHAAPVALAVTLVALAAGCSGAGPEHPASAPVPTPTPASMAQLQLPLAAYQLSNEQLSEEQYLVFLLEKRCMARLGFQFLPGLTSGYDGEGTRILDEFDSRVWGVSDPAVVRQYGYHLPAWVQGPARPQSIGSLPPAALLALTGRQAASGGASAPASGGGAGIPKGGCVQEAAQQVSAGLGQAARATPPLVAQISEESFARARSDPRTLAVFSKWSACMSAHGYSYSNPFQPAASVNQSAPPTQAEIQTAMTDVACKRKTNLLGITYAVQADYQNALIDKYAPELAQIKAQAERQARAVASLTAKIGSGSA